MRGVLEYWSIAAARITFEKQLCSFAYLLQMRVVYVRLDAHSNQLNISLSLSLSLSSFATNKSFS
jgi:hypothetical protein